MRGVRDLSIGASLVLRAAAGGGAENEIVIEPIQVEAAPIQSGGPPSR